MQIEITIKKNGKKYCCNTSCPEVAEMMIDKLKRKSEDDYPPEYEQDVDDMLVELGEKIKKRRRLEGLLK